MRLRRSSTTRWVLSGCLALGLLESGAGASSPEQFYPQVGLSSHGAQLHLEVGEGHHGPGAADYFGSAVATGDFDNDGFDDLATGLPGNDCDFVVWDCGSAQVRLGGPGQGLTVAIVLDPELQASEPAEANDQYGQALAIGDFDHDGFDDLVVGVPGNRGGTLDNDGAIHVHYGLPAAQGSLPPAADHVLRQGVGGLPTPPAGHDYSRLGDALAVGDFDADGHADLAIGDPNYRAGVGVFPGRVLVAHGHAAGLVPFDGFEMAEGLDGLPGSEEESEDFGSALAAGDFDGDGADDLAIGIPGQGDDDSGAVLVVYGSVGNSLQFDDHWIFGAPELGGSLQEVSGFGRALAVGDFDGDGIDDLAVGMPNHDRISLPILADSGAAVVVYGTELGLSPARVVWLTQDLLFSPAGSEAGDLFGSALAAGDFNGDGTDDLAVGARAEDDELFLDSGMVDIVLGRRLEDLPGTSRALWPSGHPGVYAEGLVPDLPQGEPGFGWSLATGDFDGNGFDDLAIGAPHRNAVAPAPLTDSGAVAVVYGHLFVDGFESSGFNEWSSVAP